MAVGAEKLEETEDQPKAARTVTNLMQTNGKRKDLVEVLQKHYTKDDVISSKELQRPRFYVSIAVKEGRLMSVYVTKY